VITKPFKTLKTSKSLESIEDRCQVKRTIISETTKKNISWKTQVYFIILQLLYCHPTTCGTLIVADGDCTFWIRDVNRTSKPTISAAGPV